MLMKPWNSLYHVLFPWTYMEFLSFHYLMHHPRGKFTLIHFIICALNKKLKYIIKDTNSHWSEISLTWKLKTLIRNGLEQNTNNTTVARSPSSVPREGPAPLHLSLLPPLTGLRTYLGEFDEARYVFNLKGKADSNMESLNLLPI